MRVDTYSHCPRLPAEGPIDPRDLFTSPPPDGAVHQGDASHPVGGVDAPVELEIGPGRGWFTLERLEFEPNVRIVGLEIRRKWATVVDERLFKRGLSHRGRVFAEDVKLVLPRFVSQSLSIAYLHFPDPWWKKRHEKRMVIGDALLAELSRVLVLGGELLIQTDVFERAEQYERIVGRSSAFEPWEKVPRIEDHPHGARSPRERKAMESGLPVARLRYRNLGPDLLER